MIAVIPFEVELAVERRRALDLDAVAGLAPWQTVPLGRDVVSHAHDVRRHDDRAAFGDARHLETDPGARVLFDPSHVGLEGFRCRDALGHLADLVQLEAERVGEELDDAAPAGLDRTGMEHRCLEIERVPEPEELAREAGVGVGRVVHDLGDPYGVDALTTGRQYERDQVVRETGVEAGRVEADAVGLAGLLERPRELLARERRVDHRDHGRVRDVLARRENREPVVEGLVDARFADRHVAHDVGVESEQRVLVVRREDPRRCVEPAELGGVLADLVGRVRVHADELEIGALNDAAQGVEAHVPGAPLNHAKRTALRLGFVRHVRCLLLRSAMRFDRVSIVRHSV